MDPMTIFMLVVLIILMVFVIRNKAKKKEATSGVTATNSSSSSMNLRQVDGYTGQVVFDGKTVTISRKGAMAKLSFGFAGEKRIPVSNIISVQYKEASAMLNGYIQFATAAGESVGSLAAATQDENSVVFTKSQNPAFAQLREKVESAMSARHSAPTTVVTTTTSVAEQLEKMAGLLEKGILTQEEFDKEKSKLLGS